MIARYLGELRGPQYYVSGSPMTISNDRPLRIGELAGRAGVSVQTVRYYERRGLLAAMQRRPSGYREYGPDAVERLRSSVGRRSWDSRSPRSANC